MTIGKKLMICIGSISVLTLVLGVTSLTSITQLSTSMHQSTGSTAKKRQLAGNIDAAGSDMLGAQRGILLYGFTKSPANLEKAKSMFDKAGEAWQKSLDEIRPLLITEDARQATNRLQEELVQWRSAMVEVKRLVDQGKPDVALAVATEKGLPIYEANNRDTARLCAIENENLADEAAQGAALANTSRVIAL